MSPLRTLAVSILLLGPSLASAQIFQPGTQPVGHPDGLTDSLQSSGSCATCHAGYADTDDEPYEGWQYSMMGNAARDPVFRAALAIAEVDNANAADFCVRCHSPAAWLRGRSEVPAFSAAEGARFLPDEAGYPSDDLNGVTCMACHRSTNTSTVHPNAPYLRNAQLVLLDGADSDTRLGPYAEIAGHMHGTRQSAFHATSAFCAQCHDIDNPIIMGHRADGTPTGRPMVIERTYTEWTQSAFATRQTCQDCHMPRTATPQKACSEGQPREYFRRHELYGGNTWVPLAIGASSPDSATLMPGYQRTSMGARRMLESAATVEVRDVRSENGNLVVSVRVLNRTGHKLPTGYPEGRRMWLEVQVVDALGRVVAGSGIYDPATGRIGPGAHTYETKIGQGNTPGFHFVLNDTTFEDTRIPPEGFRPNDETRPIGRDYGNDTDGYRHFDDVVVTLPACGTQLRVQARLRFQSTTREYIEFLRDNSPGDSPDPAVGDLGAEAFAKWQTHGGDIPVEMARAELPVASAACAAPDAGLVAEPDAATVADASNADAGTAPAASGCGCRAASGDAHAWLGVALVGLALGARRRRR